MDVFLVNLNMGLVRYKQMCSAILQMLSTDDTVSKWKAMARPSLPSSLDSTLPGICRDVLSVSMESKYQCQQCKEILRKPYQAQCGHRFCVFCFKQLTRYPGLLPHALHYFPPTPWKFPNPLKF